MKKILGIILAITLLFTLFPTVYAEAAPVIISVTVPQIDNQVYEYGQMVRVVCENTKFTETGVEVDIMYSTVESVLNLQIIDDYTIEFELKMYHAGVYNYGLKLTVRNSAGVPTNMYSSNPIEVRSGHIDFDINPITADELADNGLTVKFFDPKEGITGIFQMDGINVDSSKITDRVFRVYPEREVFAGKNQMEVRFIYEGNYYRKTLYINDNEIWMEPGSIARTSPISFYVNTMNLEFPSNAKDISIVIKGKGRYIDISDITILNSKRLKAYTPLPLAAGVYDMSITWPDLGMTYKIPLKITKSTIQSDMDLDEIVEQAIYETHNGFDITITEDIIGKYLASSKKTIDFSNRSIERFYLLITNASINMLVDAGSGLDIMFEDCTMSITSGTLDLGKTKDLYAIVEGGKSIPELEVRFFAPVQGFYIDTNMSGFNLSVPAPSNLYSYDEIEIVHNYIDSGIVKMQAAYEEGMLVFEASVTGTYQLVLEGMAFDDVADTYWGAKYIYPLTALEIIDGMGDGIFLPDGMVTNAQFAKMVCEAIGLETNATLSNFADVEMGSWYYSYVCAMETAGITEGVYFNPNKPMKRENMAEMVIKAYAYHSGEDISKIAAESNDAFLDITGLSIKEREYIKAAFMLEIINGMTSTRFNPEGNATRSQAAAMIYRLLTAMGIA